MNHPLDGARLKVVRAHEHLDSLKAEIRMHLDEHPSHVIKSKSDTYGQLQMLSVPPSFPVESPPLRLSTIVGDCVTNVRASIDYVVWELAQKFFVPQFDQSNFADRGLVSFPIDGTFKGSGFGDRLDRLAKRGAPTAAIDEIKTVQTYGSGDDTLLWLHKLVNTDKHRAPLLTVTELNYVTVTLATPAIYADVIKTPATFIVPGDKAIAMQGLASLRSDVQMEGQTSFCVTLHDVSMPRVPVETTLEQIIKTVADIIPRFDRFF